MLTIKTLRQCKIQIPVLKVMGLNPIGVTF
jgi:hypothetical protein